VLTEPELVEIAEGLLDGWDRVPDRMKGQLGKHPESTLVVFGLAAHVHRLGRAVLVLRREGMALEAMPLVRSAFEMALTCAWANEVPDALPALGNEDQRRWEALVRTLSSPAWPVDDAMRALWTDVSREPETTNSSGSARSFERLCGDLTQAGDVAYGLYRIMSADVHPTFGLVSRYLRPPGPAHVNLSGEPAQDTEPERWLLLVCASMVWAGRAFDFHDRDRPRRNELRRAAKALRVPEALTLSSAARLRAGKGPSWPRSEEG
jgi:hypothetical protein